MKLGRMRLARHIERTMETKIAYVVLENFKGRDHLRGLGEDWGKISKQILEK
jgi:hypothetical protein